MATNTPLNEASIDHTTLYYFYSKLEQDEKARDLFRELTTKFAEKCGTSLDKQRTDSTYARYVKKVKQKVCGHKGFVTESCDETNEVQFITDIELTPATKADSTELPLIHGRLEESEMKPKKQYCDADFVNGETILASQKKEIILEGPSSGRSRSFEAYESNERPLDVADFATKVEGDEIEVVSCPKGQKPIDQVRSDKIGKINVHFDAELCSACNKKDRCPVKMGKRVSTLNIDEKSHAGAERHHKYMEDSNYRKECAIRAGAESMVSEIVRGHGIRKSRHRSEFRTRLQLIFAAIACNTKRFIRHKGQSVQFSVIKA